MLCFRVHFIPLSATYKEIYNILAYFSGPTPSTLLSAVNSTSSSLSSASPSSPSPPSPPSPPSSHSSSSSRDRGNVLSEYALAALENQEVLQYTKEGRELLRNVEAERRLKRIARAGKEWKRTLGRKVDMEGVYMLPLPFLFYYFPSLFFVYAPLFFVSAFFLFFLSSSVCMRRVEVPSCRLFVLAGWRSRVKRSSKLDFADHDNPQFNPSP